MTTVSGSVDDLGDDTVVATRGTASEHGCSRANWCRSSSPDGDTARLRVVAILADTSAPAACCSPGRRCAGMTRPR